MSDFIVSARKYRPSSFDSVVGQEALTTTLKNAILTNKLSHAYLFCGPRGVGKTSCARIFAKTINCENRTPDGEACNECESCKAANEQRSYNITELDAASNNSVNDIRQLIEQVYIAPTSGKYRVYIIDEVHMLSSSAFNAFLKTLEEPPAHAIFVLATTEKHKVLPTIISRCQVHDFNRITSFDIANHLQKIADAEGINADPEALQMIGIAADGGMRDALSMFDQIAGFGGGNITIQGVRQNLNLLDEDEYFSLLAYILKGFHSQVLILIDKLLKKGYEGDIIMKGFSGFLRNVLLAQSQETLNIIEVPYSIKERLIKAGQYTPTYLLWDFLKISTNFSTQYKNSSDKRLSLEIALLNMCEKVTPSNLKPAPTDQPPARPIEEPQSKNTTTVSSQPYNASSAGVSNSTNQVKETSPKESTAEKIENSNAHVTKIAYKPQPVKNVIGNSNKNKYAFDLSTGQRPTKEKDVIEKKTNALQKEPFTQEQLVESWRRYAHSKNLILSKILDRQDNTPVQLQDGSIRYSVTSKVEKDQLDDVLPELTEYLRSKLKNDFISINIDYIQESDEQKTTPMTLKEKYESLKDFNPWVGKMCEDLGLNFSN
ncbi:DNA polymerase III subunit gamma/tau [Porphyromonadaceae bacterium W3.11]|nr:DNA polymerase III subunit gamma/tau [Porphyromonadaceae bacterium W3.11]